jgi:CRISPR-associated protein Csb1
MSDTVSRFDFMIAEDGPVALVVQEWLEPAGGPESVFFPPTFAPPKGSDEPANYVIDEEVDGRGVRVNSACLVDTVGAQANRLEPVFKSTKYQALVPQVKVRVGERIVDLLDAGHRAADAVVRFSDKAADFEAAFLSYDRGDASKLARLAPTSLVFGAWDSRGTQVKIPRLIDSTIRAYDVRRVSRNGQYRATLRKDEMEEMGIGADSLGEKFPAEEGLVDNPVKLVPGGVIARGGIRRDAVLNLIPIRAAGAPDEAAMLALQRYVLGLALLALLAPADFYLRQGCVLVRNSKKPAEQTLVRRSGERDPFTAPFAEIETYAKAAADAFGVGPDVQATFDPELVKARQEGKAAKKAKKAKAKP